MEGPAAEPPVNHKAPSGPAVMPAAPSPGGRAYRGIVPEGEIRPMVRSSGFVNHRAPSEPAAMIVGRYTPPHIRPGVIWNTVTAPLPGPHAGPKATVPVTLADLTPLPEA